MKITFNLKFYSVALLWSGLLFLLFIAESNVFATRSWTHLWNLGHIPLFLFVGFCVFNYFPGFEEKGLPQQLLLMVIIAFLAGSSIEIVQSFVGRDASLQDVTLDVIGGVMSVLLFSQQIRQSDFYKRVLSSCLFAMLLLFVSWPFVTSLWDESRALTEFPLLAGFEHDRELKRWTSIEKMEITEELAKSGRASLRVDLTPRAYSGIELEYFPSDWSGYRELVFYVLYPEKGQLILTVSIFDDKHRAHRFSYFDRYTKQFPLHSGWNEVRVPLDAVKNAPRKRTMDMTHVDGLRLFVARSRKRQSIYIDDVRLAN